MRDPHRFLRTILYVLTPIAYELAIGYHLAHPLPVGTNRAPREETR